MFSLCFHHRHGNNKPNWGVAGETGTVEILHPGDSGNDYQAQQQAENVLRVVYEVGGEGISFGLGFMFQSVPVYESSSSFFNYMSGNPTQIPMDPTGIEWIQPSPLY